MQLFPGRTLEELDQIDESRLYRALEARDVGRQCSLVDGWLAGTTSAEHFKGVNQDIAKEYMEWRRKKNG